MKSTMMARLQSIKPQIERWRFWRTWFGMWLKGLLGIGRRYGVRFNNGLGEKTGFYYRRDAENWIRENARNGEVFHYEPAIDMWLRGSQRPGRYSGAPVGE